MKGLLQAPYHMRNLLRAYDLINPALRHKLPCAQEALKALETFRNVFPDNTSYLHAIKDIRSGERNFILKPEQLLQACEPLSIISRYSYLLYMSKENITKISTTSSNDDVMSKAKLPGEDAEAKRLLNKKIISTLNEKFLQFKDKYEQDGTIDQRFLEELQNHFENRSPILKLSSEEQYIYNYLRTDIVKNLPSREQFISKEKDPLLPFKEKTTLDLTHLKQLAQNIYSAQDYKDQMTLYKNIISLLQKGDLDDPGLIIVATLARCLEIDQEGSPKLTRESYRYINNPSNGIIELLQKPNPKEIWECFSKKNVLLLEASAKIPPGDVVSTSPLLHKTLLAVLKDKLLMFSMLTSTKPEQNTTSTIQLGYQEINEDPAKRSKEEYLYGFPRMILLENNPKHILDLVGLGFIMSHDLQGENVYQKIVTHMQQCENEWAHNPIVKLMHITYEILAKVTLNFVKEHLTDIEQEYLEYQKEFDRLQDHDKKKYLQKEALQKATKLLEVIDAQYYSSLLPWQKILLKSIEAFEHIVQKEEKANQKSADKAMKTKAMEELNNNKPKPDPNSAAERRKKYTENKAKEKEKEKLRLAQKNHSTQEMPKITNNSKENG